MEEGAINAVMGMEMISNANSAEVREKMSTSTALDDGWGKKKEIGESPSSGQSAVGDSTQNKAKEYYVMVGEAEWDAKELGVLEEARRLLSTERHSNMAIYIKIAAMLPYKTVRDVAFKFMELNSRIENMKKMEATQQHTTSEHQQFYGRPGQTASTSSPPVNMFIDERLCECMRENATIISKMRENLTTGRLMENIEHMKKFNMNVIDVKKYLEVQQLQIPPIPIDVDLRLLQYNAPPMCRSFNTSPPPNL